MNELRWILLGAGLVLLAGIYAWGVRARRRAAGPGQERVVRVEPAHTVAVVPEPAPVAYDADLDEARFDEPAAAEVGTTEMAEFEPPPPSRGARREPRFEPTFDERIETRATSPRLEPRIEPRIEPRLEPRPEPTEIAEPAPVAEPEPAPPSRQAPAAEPSRRKAQQRIFALRVVAPAGTKFDGAQLLEAIEGDGFAFGRYQIFHRQDDTGRTLVSLASLKEPGTFDPAAMPNSQFRGVALFTVLPGPIPGVQAFDELVVTARALAATLSGQIQDERGGPLTLQRIRQLRDEVAAFDGDRGVAPEA